MTDNEINEALERIRSEAAQWPDIVISGEQQFAAKEAEVRMSLGQISTWEAMLRCAFAGVPLPGAIIDRLIAAQTAYDEGKTDDLAVMLGVALSAEHKKAMAELVAKRQLAWAVADEIEQGAKTKASKGKEPTAFARAAKRAKRIEAPALKRFQSVGEDTAKAAYYDRDCADIRVLKKRPKT